MICLFCAFLFSFGRYYQYNKMLPILLAFLLPPANAQEVATPASLLGPLYYNHHAFDAERYLQDLKTPKPTKKGPILFPNDGPPPPRTPLVVTSRPLLESIAKSDLNNSLPSSSQLNQVAYKPAYLAKLKEYKPYSLPVTVQYDFGPTIVPFATARSFYGQDNYEERTATLPSIYKVFERAEQRVLKIQQRPIQYDYQLKNTDYGQDYETNNVDDGSNEQYTSNHGDNYAFSYAVKDKNTGDDFSHSQSSSGSATNGEYRVRLPDGRMQIVSYTADENGYKADVRYDDEDKIENNRHSDYVDNRQNHYDANRHNDYTNRQGDYTNRHDDYTNRQGDYTNRQDDTDKIDDYSFNSRSQVNTDYAAQDKNYKTNDYYYPSVDVSKEYSDYSSEYSTNYPPHKSKFSSFVTKDYDTATVRPSYEELKPLLVDKNVYSARQVDVTPTVSSTTANPAYDITTEKVVVIGTKRPNLFTNIKNIIAVSPTPLTFASPVVSSTPRSYLISTIANLKNRINLSNKPILSDSFIERINKYLTYK